MARTKATKKLVLNETHPRGYTGLPYLTGIQSIDKMCWVVVIDNIDRSTYTWYNPELARSEGELMLLLHTVEMWVNAGKLVPLSIFVCKQDLQDKLHHMFQSYKSDEIVRVMGPLWSFDMVGYRTSSGRLINPKIKRKKVKRV